METNEQLVKEQYRRMADGELIWFAAHEAETITPDAFRLLVEEFHRRDLDAAIIESAQIDRDLVAATQISAFEKTTADAFIGSIWKFAIEEKELGTSDEELLEMLIKKNITPEYAAMLIQSIPSKLKDLLESIKTQLIAGWVLLVTGIGLFVVTVNASRHGQSFFLFGITMFMIGLLRLLRSYSNEKKYGTILAHMEEEKKKSGNIFQ